MQLFKRASLFGGHRSMIVGVGLMTCVAAAVGFSLLPLTERSNAAPMGSGAETRDENAAPSSEEGVGPDSTETKTEPNAPIVWKKATPAGSQAPVPATMPMSGENSGGMTPSTPSSLPMTTAPQGADSTNNGQWRQRPQGGSGNTQQPIVSTPTPQPMTAGSQIPLAPVTQPTFSAARSVPLERTSVAPREFNQVSTGASSGSATDISGGWHSSSSSATMPNYNVIRRTSTHEDFPNKGQDLTPPGLDIQVPINNSAPMTPIPQNTSTPAARNWPDSTPSVQPLPTISRVPANTSMTSAPPKPLNPGIDIIAPPLGASNEIELVPPRPVQPQETRVQIPQTRETRPQEIRPPDVPTRDLRVPLTKPITDADPDLELGKPRNVNPKATDPDAVEPQPKKQTDDDATTEDKATLLGAARAAAQQKSYATALARFAEFFKKYPNDDNNRALRKEYIDVLVASKKFKEAVAELQALIATQRLSDPDSTFRVQLSDISIIQGDYAQAIAQLRKALELNPRDPEASVRLARSYILNEDYPLALELYDQNLKRFQPTDKDTPALLGTLLIELERPSDAVPFIQAQLAKEGQGSDANLLSTLVRAYSRMKDRVRAEEALQTLYTKAPGSDVVLLQLAQDLTNSGEYDMAAKILEQLLRQKPDDPEARIALATVNIRLYLPQPARQLLDKVDVKGDKVIEHSLWLTRGEYHLLVGEFLTAKEIYRRFLLADDLDYEFRFALATVQEFMGEFQKAKAEYAKIPPSSRFYRRARIGIVSCLTKERLFDKAIEIALQNIREKPWDGNYVARLILTYGKAMRIDFARDYATGFLRANPRNEPAQLPVRLALGRILLDGKQYREAVGEYQELLTRPYGQIAETYYGLARALEGAKEPVQAQEALKRITSLVGGDVRNRLMLADLNANDNNDQETLTLVQGAEKYDPNNLAVLVRLADVQLRLSIAPGIAKDAKATAEKIIGLSPANVRGRMTLARALGVEKNYKGAVAAYDGVLAADHDYLVPQRERARMLYSANDFGAGAAAYAEILNPPADAIMHANLASLAQRDQRPDSPLMKYASNDKITGKELQSPEEMARMAGDDPNLQSGLRYVFLDYEARSMEQNFVRLEAEVKELNWKKRTAEKASSNLATIEPANTSNLFDGGQSLGSLQENHLEEQVYQRELVIDPNAREANIALARSIAETRPELFFDFNYSGENGRDGLAHIRRYRYTTDFRWHYGDEDQYVDAAFSRVNYVPANGDSLHGNIITVAAQDKFFEDRLHLNGIFNIEQFPDRLKTKPTGSLDARYDLTDQLTFRGGFFLENVAENSESLNQDIYRYGGRVGVTYLCDRRTTLNSTFTAGHYSDDNNYAELYSTAQYTVCFAPCELKFELVTDFLSYSDPSIIRNLNGVALLGTTHPYFSPSFYSFYEARIEWKHWLSRDTFTHSNQCYYGLQYGIGFDNSLNNYNSFRAFINYDVNTYFSVGVDGTVILSEFYNAQTFFAYAIVRFP